MADYSDVALSMRALRDPATPAADLADIARRQPDLWPQVAMHTNAYPELLDWLTRNGGSTVKKAVAAREVVVAAALASAPVIVVAPESPAAGAFQAPREQPPVTPSQARAEYAEMGRALSALMGQPSTASAPGAPDVAPAATTVSQPAASPSLHEPNAGAAPTTPAVSVAQPAAPRSMWTGDPAASSPVTPEPYQAVAPAPYQPVTLSAPVPPVAPDVIRPARMEPQYQPEVPQQSPAQYQPEIQQQAPAQYPPQPQFQPAPQQQPDVIYHAEAQFQPQPQDQPAPQQQPDVQYHAEAQEPTRPVVDAYQGQPIDVFRPVTPREPQVAEPEHAPGTDPRYQPVQPEQYQPAPSEPYPVQPAQYRPVQSEAYAVQPEQYRAAQPEPYQLAAPEVPPLGTGYPPATVSAQPPSRRRRANEPRPGGAEKPAYPASETSPRQRRMVQSVEDYDESYAEESNTGRSKAWIIWVVLAVVLAALLTAGVVLFRAGAFDSVLGRNAPSPAPTTSVTPPVPTLPVTPSGSWSQGSGGFRDPSGKITGTAAVISDDLQTGDCVYNFSGADAAGPINTLVVVPCTSEHEAEVYATQTQVDNLSPAIKQFCTDQFQSFIGVPISSSSLQAKFVHAPESQAKTNVQCIVYNPGVLVTSSYKGYNE